MCYQIAIRKEYDNPKSIKIGETLKEKITFLPNARYSYKLRLRGEMEFPFEQRTERKYSHNLRKIDHSLIKEHGEYVLSINKLNYEHERSCYYMITDITDFEKEYDFSVKAKAFCANNNLKVTAEIYYGQKKTRYYYQAPDKTYEFNLIDSDDYKIYSEKIKFSDAVDFIMIKISAIDFAGEAKIYAPKFNCGEKEFIETFEYAPEKIGEQKWIGEGFSFIDRPFFKVEFNGQIIFEGRKDARLNRYTEVKFDIPDNLIGEENQIEITYLDCNKFNYSVKEIGFMTAPKELEILGVQKYQNVGKKFGLFYYFGDSKTIDVKTSDGITLLDKINVHKGFGVLQFVPTREGENQKISVTDGKTTREYFVTVNGQKTDGVITGTGDFIYIKHDFDDFCEYVSWYLNENIGDLLTLRSNYDWGCTAELDKDFWDKAVKLLSGLCLYYSIMTDGRELNGINANATKEMLDSEYFLGEQTHERDGAYTYWGQRLNEHDTHFRHLMSRKMERTGIFGRQSPVYDKSGTACSYYASDDMDNVEKAHQKFVKNLKQTASDGATRHTGVTPMFSAFFEAGYNWVGYESMYGNHEINLSAIRGMSNSVDNKSFGTHLALQWGSFPTDEKSHVDRYKLSLYESYLHGTTEINTEEGLWITEFPFQWFDRFSKACVEHKIEQQKFNCFIKCHDRKKNHVRKIAMMVGKYDGMDNFSAGRVYGQADTFWKYQASEHSWDLIKAFYPDAKTGAIYRMVTNGGKEKLADNYKELLNELPYLYGNYGGEVSDYQSLGYFSGTPFGMIDLISADAKNLSDYDFIFLLGWNSCTEEQLKRFCEYVKNGGTLMLCKAHLFDSVDREDVFTGKGKVIDSEFVDQLLSYQSSGKLIYFDKDGYPIDFKEEYIEQLKKAGQRFGCKIIKDSDRVIFAEHDGENGEKYFYAMNICWWNQVPATFNLKLSTSENTVKLRDTEMKMIGVTPDRRKAIMLSSLSVDISSIENDYAILKGFGKAVITTFIDGVENTENRLINGMEKIALI